MRGETKKFIDRLAKQRFPEFVESVILFGSEVYGKPNLLSDIDIAIVSKSNIKIKQRVIIEEMIELLEPPYSCKIIFVSKQENYSRNDVRKDIFEKGLNVYAV